MPQYGFVGKSNNGNYLPGNQWTTFNSIFYKTTRFDVIKEGQFWLSSTPDVPSYSFNGNAKRNCVYVLFKEKPTGLNFIFLILILVTLMNIPELKVLNS